MPPPSSPPRPYGGARRRGYTSQRQTPGTKVSTRPPNTDAKRAKSGGLYGFIIRPILTRVLQLVRNITSWQAFITVCLAFGAMLLALSGVATLGTLGLARRYTHVKSNIIRPLEFDYSSPIAIATVSLYDPPPRPSLLQSLSHALGYAEALPEHHHLDLNGVGLPADPKLLESHHADHTYHTHDATSQHYRDTSRRDQQKLGSQLGLKRPPTNLRPLEPGQPVSVQLTLELPSDHVDLFQVSVELLSKAGKVVAQAARTYMPAREHWISRTLRDLFKLPFQVIGWSSSNRLVSIQVIDRYIEQQASPVTYLRVKLSARNSPNGLLPPPPVFKGRVNVQLRLGVGRWLLAALAPSWMFNLLVGSMAVGLTLVGAITAAVLMCCAFVLHRLSGVGSTRPKPPSREQLIAQELARMVTAARGSDSRPGGAPRPAPVQYLEDLSDLDGTDDEGGSQGTDFGGGDDDDDDSMTHGPPDLGRFKDMPSKVSKGSLPELYGSEDHQGLAGELRDELGEIEGGAAGLYGSDDDEGRLHKDVSVFENRVFDDGDDDDSCNTPTAAKGGNRSSTGLSAHTSHERASSRSRPGSSTRLNKVSASRLGGSTGAGLDQRASGSSSTGDLTRAEAPAGWMDAPQGAPQAGGRDAEGSVKGAGARQEQGGKGGKPDGDGVVMGGLFAALQQQVRQRAAPQPAA